MSSSITSGLSTEAFNPKDFDSLNAAYKSVAGALGTDPERPVSFRAGASDIDGSQAPADGMAYVASIKLGDKA